MCTKRIVVLVSGGGTNLQALIDAQTAGKLQSGQICAVISSSLDAYALKRAETAKIPGIVVNRKEFSSKEAFADALLSVVQAQNPDVIVLAGFMCILSSEFCRAFENRIINVHPALIPSFCGDGYFGIHVHEAALVKGVKVSGATVHFVNEITDGGPIILQKAVPVLDDDTPETLQKRIMEEAEWVIMPEAVQLFCSEKLEVENNRVKIKK